MIDPLVGVAVERPEGGLADAAARAGPLLEEHDRRPAVAVHPRGPEVLAAVERGRDNLDEVAIRIGRHVDRAPAEQHSDRHEDAAADRNLASVDHVAALAVIHVHVITPTVASCPRPGTTSAAGTAVV
jgi:hypothetical protein